MKILRLHKRLARATEGPRLKGIRLRPFGGPADVTAWLRLRTEAFSDNVAAGSAPAGSVAAGRPWTAADFEREFLARPWWRAEALWLAETLDSPDVVGSVALGRSGRPPDERACIQWLMVAPEFRRRGIGAALVAAVERAAVEQGETELVLETHADWRDAVRLYERLGYEPLR